MKERVYVAADVDGERIGTIRVLESGPGNAVCIVDNFSPLPDYRLATTLLLAALECLADTNAAQLVAGALDQIADDTKVTKDVERQITGDAPF